MKLSVIGSRTFENYEMLVNEILKLNLNISSVISGGAKGADTLAERQANENIIESCEYCLAFWDDKSKGTKFSIDLCKKLKKPIKVVIFTNLNFI